MFTPYSRSIFYMLHVIVLLYKTWVCIILTLFDRFNIVDALLKNLSEGVPAPNQIMALRSLANLFNRKVLPLNNF